MAKLVYMPLHTPFRRCQIPAPDAILLMCLPFTLPCSSPGTPGAPGGGAISEAALMALDDEIRDAIRARRTVYESSKDMLMRMFK